MFFLVLKRPINRFYLQLEILGDACALLGIVRRALNSSVPSGWVVADYGLNLCIRVVGIWVAIGIATILVIISRTSISDTFAGAIGPPGSAIRR